MKENDIIGDLMKKTGEDVTRAILRTLAICPRPHLPLVLAAAAAAIGTVASILDEMTDKKLGNGPNPENVLLAGLLAARTAISPNDGVAAAYRDFEVLKSAGRLTALASN